MSAARLTPVSGVFYRSIAAIDRDFVLNGSIRAGRYSAPDQRTLYLSSSPEGVEAAMRKYNMSGDEERVLCTLQVEGATVLDLRNIAACHAVGIDPAAAAQPWSDAAARGEDVPSWRVREQAEDFGADGLVDPSRSAPVLWHLVLFRWNTPGAPTVTLIQ